jgi:hypothetical protein
MKEEDYKHYKVIGGRVYSDKYNPNKLKTKKKEGKKK